MTCLWVFGLGLFMCFSRLVRNPLLLSGLVFLGFDERVTGVFFLLRGVCRLVFGDFFVA